MMKTILLGLIFFQLHVYSKCYIFPKNHEITYNYRALIETGMNEQNSTSSDFYIEALLTVINKENINIVSLKDIKHSIYAKNLENKEEYFTTITEGSQSISKPFVLQYNSQGELVEIETQTDDEIWSRNIKKGIANLFQVDLQWKNSIDITNKIKNFTINEKSIQGTCDVYYTVSKKGNLITVMKRVDFEKCQSNNKLNIKHENLNNVHSQISVMNLITYEIENKTEDVLIRSINGYNEINYDININQVLNAYIYQNISLVNIKEISGKLDLKIDTMTKDSLSFEFSNENNLNRLIGKKIEVTTDDILQNFQEIYNFFDRKTDEANGIVEKLFLSLQFANKKKMMEYFDHLSDVDDNQVYNMKHFYLKTICHIGTHASVSFLLDLIKKNLTDELHSLALLTNIPFYIKIVDEPLLLEYENLIKTENISKSVRTMATLSFGTILSTVDNEMKTKLVNELINNTLTCQEYVQCFSDICTLSNMKDKKAFEFLEDIVKNEFLKFSDDVRNLAMTVLRNHYSSEDYRIFKIYWPIFVNTGESKQIRLAALNTLLMTPVENLEKNVDFLNNNSEKQIYNYLKMYLNAYVDQNPDNNYAKDLLKLLHRPVDKQYQDFYHSIGYNNLRKGMNISIRGNGELMTDKFWTLYGEYNFKKGDYISEKIAYYLNAKVQENCTYQKSDSGNIGHFIILTEDYQEGVEIDLISFKNNYISFALHIASNEVSKWKKHLEYLFNYDYEISQSVYGNEFIISSIGIPIFITVKSPLIYKKIKWEEIFLLSPPFILFEQLSLTENSVMFFNPLLELWHGVSHKDSKAHKFPELSGSENEGNFNLTFLKNHVYFDITSYNYEFILDNKFEEKKCENLNFKCGVIRKAKKDPKEKIQLFKRTSQFFDTTYGLDMYGCESYVFNESMQVSFFDLTVDTFDITMSFLKLHDFMTDISEQDLCKFKFYIRPNQPKSYFNFDKRSSILSYKVLTEEFEEKKIFDFEFNFLENSTHFNTTTDTETTYTDIFFNTKDNPNFEFDVKINSGIIVNELREKESTLLESKILSEFSDEQRNLDVYKQTYEECMSKEIGSIRCILEQTFSRHIWFKLNYKELPVSYKDFIKSILKKVINKYFTYLEVNSRDSEVDENTIEFDITFPITSNTMNMSIKTSHTNNNFNLIPIKNSYKTLYLTPFNSLFTFINKLRFILLKYQMCEINMDYVKNIYNINTVEMSTNWTKLLGRVLRRKDDDDLHWIYAKKENDKLYVRYQFDDKINLIITYDDEFIMTIDDEIIKPTEEIIHSRFYKSVILPNRQRILILIPDLDWIIDYTEKNIKIHFTIHSRLLYEYGGKCL